MRRILVACGVVVGIAVVLLSGSAALQGLLSSWNNEQIVNFWTAWIPFAISVLLAFIPDHQMKPRARITWRALVIVCGFFYSALLWHQQQLTSASSLSSQQKILSDAVKQSNSHSDEQIGEVRKDVQGVKTDLENKIGDTISRSTSQLSGKYWQS